ncbi:Translation initiation factor 3 subunit b [Orbilia brochopaga]|uniref:Eukaryotic translation initiation factor 3 subunit B n=1 Tax=Orbilia brochopaga TaxID=3140254 RepID=A0AAV9UKT7_9PEZI
MTADEFYDDEEDIDFSDLREQYEVKLEEGLDTFVVIDGLPKVPEENKPKLVKFLIKRLQSVGKTKEDSVYMPMDDEGQSQGFAFVEFETAMQAAQAVKKLNGLQLDKKHTIAVNKLTDIERYGREGRIDEQYTAPEPEPFVEQEHLRSWLGDERARDQFVLFKSDTVGVYFNNMKEAPEMTVERQFWTESFVRWSPLGTFLTSLHPQGVQLWGGASWKRMARFPHPAVNLVDFSPNEKYLVTWSNKPIVYQEGMPGLTPEEDGKTYVVWDVRTGKLLRSFAPIENPQEADKPPNMRKKIQWPLFKWTADDKYCARVTPGSHISVYETPKMVLLDKKSIKLEGVMDFEWSPYAPSEEDAKKPGSSEQLLCYWTPELGNQTARVALMAIPSKEIVRTRNLFNVSDCKLHWQSEGTYLCVKVDRHSKRGKSTFTNLEFFRIKEKNIPNEVIEIQETVINFAWEPKGDRFVFITAGELPPAGAGAPVPPKTAVSFYAPEKTKSPPVGPFKLIRTIDKKNSNAIFWSPKGRFCLIATINSQQSNELEFWDFDFDGEKKETEKDLAANLQLIEAVDHYGVTDVEWDPSGRYVVSSSSIWKHTMENGYHMYDFKGKSLREDNIDRFKQFAWRPRPPTMLSKEQQKQIRKNLREYSRQFDETDLALESEASAHIIAARRRLLDEWRAWRAKVEEELTEERADLGLRPFGAEEEEDPEGTTVIEETVEEVIDEREEEIA